MPGVPAKIHRYWGYKYDKDCPVDEDRRNQIAKLMRKKGYKSKYIQFRSTGMRYDYWKPVSCISDISSIAPVVEDDFGDSDCGNLFYYVWV